MVLKKRTEKKILKNREDFQTYGGRYRKELVADVLERFAVLKTLYSLRDKTAEPVYWFTLFFINTILFLIYALYKLTAYILVTFMLWTHQPEGLEGSNNPKPPQN